MATERRVPVNPMIFAVDRRAARAYAERRGIRRWDWARVPSDAYAAAVAGQDLILLPGYGCHHLAHHAERAYALALRLSEPVN